MRAILPAAGRGTRMASVTGGRAKEALPLARLSVLGRVLLECRIAGSDVTIVWARGKGPVPYSSEYVPHVVYQPEPRGLGEAVRRGLGDEDAVLVALPDVVFPGRGPLDRLVSALDAGADFAVAVEAITPERAHLYGIAEIAGEEDWRIERLVEKPAPGETMSLWAVAARFALGPLAVRTLREWPEPEFGLTEVLEAVLEAGGIGLAVPLFPNEIRYDCGSPEGYAAAREVWGP